MPTLADIFDDKIAALDKADQLGKTGVGRFDPLIDELAKATGLSKDEIYVVGCARPNNFHLRLSQGSAQDRHRQLALGVIYKNVKPNTVEAGLNAAARFIGPGNAHYDAIGVVIKKGDKWSIEGLVEAPGADISKKLQPAFPKMIVRNPAAAPAPSAPAIPAVRDPAAIASSFSAALHAAHLNFGSAHDDLVRRFLCSLMAKPFAILTGLSGSGKTQLAQQLGYWFGEGRSLLVPVRPDWTGPEALLGFENALGKTADDGRRPWVVPRVLEFILRAMNDSSGRPYLLILDEMNLAHVERYFADMLSGMEASAPVIPNLLQEQGGWYSDPESPLEVFPPNLFVVGTVNVDETTYLFSPKVLDRANTIEFRVPTDALPKDLANTQKPKRVAEGNGGLLLGFADITADSGWHLANAPPESAAFIQHLHNLHEGLSVTGYEFGHRTFYEGVRLGALLAKATVTGLEDRLDIFVLHKVLPRLHGSRRKLERILRSIAAFAFDLRHPKDGLEFEIENAAAPPRLPRTFAKIRRMHESLKVNQFASFSD